MEANCSFTKDTSGIRLNCPGLADGGSRCGALLAPLSDLPFHGAPFGISGTLKSRVDYLHVDKTVRDQRIARLLRNERNRRTKPANETGERKSDGRGRGWAASAIDPTAPSCASSLVTRALMPNRSLAASRDDP
eukprot:3129533-Pyramimonas_sp.AAC.2